MSKPERTIVFEQIYNSYLEKKGLENREQRGYKHFHPSAFGECSRKMAIQYFSEIDTWYKTDVPVDPRIQRLFGTGHAIHERLQRDFGDMRKLRGWWRSKITGKVYGKENPHGIFRPKTVEEVGEKQHPEDKRTAVEVFDYEEIKIKDEELNFEGHVDAIMDFVPDDPDERFVVDFKTINSDKFKILREPDPKYVTQIHIYMMILGIPRSVIFYEDKNRSEIKEFLVELDTNYAEHIRDTAKKLFSDVNNKRLPKISKMFSPDSPPCVWCDYKRQCYEIAARKKKK